MSSPQKWGSRKDAFKDRLAILGITTTDSTLWHSFDSHQDFLKYRTDEGGEWLGNNGLLQDSVDYNV